MKAVERVSTKIGSLGIVVRFGKKGGSFKGTALKEKHPQKGGFPPERGKRVLFVPQFGPKVRGGERSYPPSRPIIM